jgi:hypothetical protein
LKQVPLAIEVPVAYVITSGPACIDYDTFCFTSLGDFGIDTQIAVSPVSESLMMKNFGAQSFSEKNTFMNSTENTSPVLLATTMELNEVRTLLVNYDKRCVFFDSEEIYCAFTYEWSIGSGSENEIAAAEKLLSWMLGNVYQNTLMVSKCNDGQIPVNSICFHEKIESRYLAPIEQLYENFIFERKEDAK